MNPSDKPILHLVIVPQERMSIFHFRAGCMAVEQTRKNKLQKRRLWFIPTIHFFPAQKAAVYNIVG